MSSSPMQAAGEAMLESSRLREFLHHAASAAVLAKLLRRLLPKCFGTIFAFSPKLTPYSAPGCLGSRSRASARKLVAKEIADDPALT